jgi:hypothetical protein
VPFREVIMAATSLEGLLERVRAEYLEMPGLRLKVEQVHRLFGVDRPLCQQVLDALVAAKFLCAKADGTYSRLTDGAMVGAPAQSSRFTSSGRAVIASS